MSALGATADNQAHLNFEGVPMVRENADAGRALISLRFPERSAQVKDLRGYIANQLLSDYALIVSTLYRYRGDPEMHVFVDEFMAIEHSIEQEILAFVSRPTNRNNIIPFRKGAQPESTHVPASAD